MNMQLLKRAVVLFPRTDYLDPQAVRHARKRWVESVACLRQQGKWILDRKVERVQ